MNPTTNNQNKGSFNQMNANATENAGKPGDKPKAATAGADENSPDKIQEKPDDSRGANVKPGDAHEKSPDKTQEKPDDSKKILV